MSDAREQMLASIRRALDTQSRASAPVPGPSAAPEPRLAHADLVPLFIERLRDYGASVTPCEPARVRDGLLDACERHGARRLVIPPQLPEQWRPDGVELVADEALTPEQLDAVDGVITGAAVGIADTGAIALDAALDQGRRVLTLIPDLHLCVIEAERVVAALPEALELLSAAVRGGRAVTLISGPSATADIELRRVEGVHGPRRLEVIVSGG